MEQEHNDNKIYWVYGNTQALLIPLEQEVIRDGEEGRTEPYYPDADAEVVVSLVGRFRRYNYTPVVNGNLLTISDEGTLPVGCYGVQVVVNNPDGTQHRSLWENQVVVTNDNVRTLQEWDEFKEQNPHARAAVFFFAKGDPFTYEDFTPEEIEELQKPALDAAAEVAALEQNIENAEALRVEAERGREQAEGQRSQAEAGRVLAEQGRVDAEKGRVQAEQGRVNAEDERVLAEQQRAEAFAGYERRMETMEGTVGRCEEDVAAVTVALSTKLDEITREQFDAIFN